MLSLPHPGTDARAARPRRVRSRSACSPAAAPRPARCTAASDAEHRQDYDLAVVEYTKALRAPSRRRQTRAWRSSARKLRASQDHFIRGRRLAATGKFDQALVEYEVARS